MYLGGVNRWPRSAPRPLDVKTQDAEKVHAAFAGRAFGLGAGFLVVRAKKSVPKMSSIL